MNGITCPRCKLSLIADEYRSHKCTKNFTGVKTIPIRSFYDSVVDFNGDEVIMMDGEDGILYRLVKCTHQIPHVMPSNRDLTGKKNNRRPNSFLTQ
ncbi:MAG: hypothetical protein ACREAR_08030 [Nitrosotalea sp.]